MRFANLRSLFNPPILKSSIIIKIGDKYVKTKLKSKVPIANRSGLAISSARSLSNVELQLVTRL